MNRIETDSATGDLPIAPGTHVQMAVANNGVAVVSFDVPESKLNVLSETLMGQLDGILGVIASRAEIKGVIFISGKRDSFIAGADINAIEQIQCGPPMQAYRGSQLGKEVFLKIEKLAVPTVAAINGLCLGGGLELALACRYRIAADNAATKLGFPEIALGFIPGWGGTVRCPKRLGLLAGLNLILAPMAPVNPKKAWKLGLIDEVVEPEKLRQRADEIVLGTTPRWYIPSLKDKLSRFALEGNPLGRLILQKQAMKQIKRESKGHYPAPPEVLKLLLKNYTRSEAAAYEAESQSFARLATSTVSRNLVGIFFAQTDSKKMPAGIAPETTIAKVGVIGAGVMGSGIAQAAAYGGYNVVLTDVEQKLVDKGYDHVKRLFEGLVAKHRLSEEEKDKKLNAITATTDFEKLSDCDLVIEAVVEDIKIKQDVLQKLEKTIKKPFIFATNTSSLSVNQLAKAAQHADKVVGIHFFNPVHKMPLVEIVKGEATSEETLALAKQFAMKLGKTTVTVADAPGFVVNRILAPYLREAVILLEAGVNPEMIDKAMTGFGMPMGPFTLMDEVGLDIGAKVTHVLHEALGERMSAPALMSQLEHLKLTGKKGGKGFFLYDENGKKAGLNPDVSAAIETPKAVIGAGAIQDRLVLIMVNEAARCLEEEVVSDAAQLDLAMIMGTGFPPFRGGVLRYADQIGIKIIHQKLAFLSKVAGENYVPCKLILQKAAVVENFYPL
jgi:3-hydroxyacyl-CoA dehydrogenase/enoyl-CoA hydratase/3-hydroxybutyryl-CoA epimerase